MRACFFLAWLVVAGGVTQSISVHSETTCSPTAWQYSLTLLVPACTAVACKAGYVGTLPTALSVSCDGPEEPRPTGRQVEVAVFEDEACTLWMLTFLAEPGVCVDTRRNPYRGTTFRASFGSVRAACLSDGSVLITTFVDAQCRNATPTQYPQLMSGCNRGQDALGYGSNSVRASCAGASGGSGGGNLSFDLGGHGLAIALSCAGVLMLVGTVGMCVWYRVRRARTAATTALPLDDMEVGSPEALPDDAYDNTW